LLSPASILYAWVIAIGRWVRDVFTKFHQNSAIEV